MPLPHRVHAGLCSQPRSGCQGPRVRSRGATRGETRRVTETRRETQRPQRHGGDIQPASQPRGLPPGAPRRGCASAWTILTSPHSPLPRSASFRTLETSAAPSGPPSLPASQPGVLACLFCVAVLAQERGLAGWLGVSRPDPLQDLPERHGQTVVVSGDPESRAGLWGHGGGTVLSPEGPQGLSRVEGEGQRWGRGSGPGRR